MLCHHHVCWVWNTNRKNWSTKVYQDRCFKQLTSSARPFHHIQWKTNDLKKKVDFYTESLRFLHIIHNWCFLFLQNIRVIRRRNSCRKRVQQQNHILSRQKPLVRRSYGELPEIGFSVERHIHLTVGDMVWRAVAVHVFCLFEAIWFCWHI